MIGNEEDGGPMPRLDNSIDIKVPLETVFEYLTDIPSHPEWVKWTKDAEITSIEKKGLGVTTSEVMQVGPRKERVETIVTEYKPEEFFTQRHTRGMEMTNRLSVVRLGDATKVAWSIDYVPPMGAMGKMMDLLFMERLFDQLMKDSLTLLRQRLESTR
jgi:uncharacterized membrane protein